MLGPGWVMGEGVCCANCKYLTNRYGYKTCSRIAAVVHWFPKYKVSDENWCGKFELSPEVAVRLMGVQNYEEEKVG